MGKSVVALLCLSILTCPLLAQVGINTIDPKAQLDIHSSSKEAPEIIDGILIPRIRNFPASQPTIEQNGILVFLETDKPNYPAGFYYWNHSRTSWFPLTGNTSTNFYKEATTIPSTNISDGIYRYGNIGIGGESPEAKLSIKLDSLTEDSTRTGLEIDNSSPTPTHVTYGIINNNRTSTSGTKYGLKNNVSASGRGIHYGVYNEVYQSTAEDMYGFYNKVGRTYGVSKNHYGIYSEIGTPLGSGMVYGIYSKAEGDNPEKVYAGYFAGRIGIGSTPEEQYILPSTKGKENQTLSLGAEGSMEWKYQGSQTYTSTGAATGIFIIPDETYTLEINDGISSINIPEASLHRGRIIVLLAWNGISQKPLVFIGTDDLWDVASASSITSISGGQRMSIQSTGTRWVVIGGR